ncbi:MAG: VanZ family protein [Ruminococcus sp.]|nr:VanZ family protein [Ruminococcus sp.]
MSKSKIYKHSVFSIIMLVITGLYIIFIWWHSTLTAEESTVESTNVLLFVVNLLKGLGFTPELTDHIIRKSAHFCEFALLGLLTLWSAYLNNKKIIRNLMPIGFVCLATAVIDELVQIGSKGRSAEVTDVALDFCGAVTGVIIFLIIFVIVRLIKKAK